MFVFTWACWNGATYYIDVFGRRMEKDLEQLKKEGQKMSQSPGETFASPMGSPSGPQGREGDGKTTALDLGPAAQQNESKESTVKKRETKEMDGALVNGTS